MIVLELTGMDLSDSDTIVLVAVGAILIHDALQYFQLGETVRLLVVVLRERLQQRATKASIRQGCGPCAYRCVSPLSSTPVLAS